jgi:2-keto-4-pentenoate hydratase/2-oxohepta-3-ene-1,7-dioic acid hydratase in catechol pathway
LTIFNDLSARDIQAREHSNKVILLGKSFNGSCPLGPYLVTMDEVGDQDNLKMVCKLNGEVRQDSSTANMVYKIAEPGGQYYLQPGDVLTTGSPPGVIAGQNRCTEAWPVDCTVDKLGTLPRLSSDLHFRPVPCDTTRSRIFFDIVARAVARPTANAW